MKLKDQIAVVTGGSRGIGYAVVRAFLKEGAEVVLCASRSETAERAVSQLKAELPEARVWGIWPSLEDPEQVRTAFDRIGAEHGRIDILVNNAGITRDAQFQNMTEKQWNDVLRINLDGPYHCCKHVVPLMREQGYGRIVNISSSSANGNFGQANYAASKAAIMGMTRVQAKELGKYGINVNAIAPGYMDTEMSKDLQQMEQGKQLTKRIPMGRWGHPEDLMGTVVFLASSASDYISGVTLPVDGGHLAS